MTRRRWILLSLLAAVPILLIVSALVVMAFFQPQLKQLFEQELNKHLSARITLQGDATFSLFRHFPDASFTFHDVIISGGAGFEEDTLLQAGSLSFRFNPFSLLSSQYEVTAIHLHQADLFARIDRQGRANYHIIQQDTTAEVSDRQVSLSLQKARFTDVRFRYLDESEDLLLQSTLYDIMLTGDFAASIFSLEASGDLSVDTLVSGGENWLAHLPVSIDLSASVDAGANHYEVHQLELVLEGDTYLCSGTIAGIQQGWMTDLQVEGRKVRLGSLISLLPPVVSARLQGLSSKGDLTFSASCRGALSDRTLPKMAASFSLENGMITHPELPRAFTEVYLEGEITSGDGNVPGGFRLPVLSGKLGNDPISGHFSYEGFANPVIDLGLDAVLDVSQLSGLLATTGWEEATGRLAIEGLRIKGSLSEMASSNAWHRLTAGGKVVAAGVGGQYMDQSWRWEAGALELNRNQLDIQDIVLYGGNSDVTISGKVDNLLTWLASFSAGEAPAILSLDVGVASDYLNYQDLEPFLGTVGDDTATSSGNFLGLFTGARGVVQLSIDSLDVYTFHAADVRGRVRPSSYLGRIEELALSVAGGQLLADGIWRVQQDRLLLEGNISGKDLQADALFLSFDNFWQDFLVADNLSGSIDGTIDLYLAWDSTLSWLEDATDVKAALTVSEGRLVDFEPMQQLSDYVKVDELQDIRFSTMRNMVYIRGDKVYIPAMEIRSTALNLWVAGTHTFDNRVDYQFKIDLLDMLARKFRMGRMDLERAEQKEGGVFNVYVTMTGTVDDPVFDTDRARVLQGFAESVEWLEPGFIIFDGEDLPRSVNRPRSVQGDEELEFIDW